MQLWDVTHQNQPGSQRYAHSYAKLWAYFVLMNEVPTMLTTPLGKIKIYADGNCVCYKAVEHNFRQPPCKDRPVAGCYRIEISCRGISTVSCVFCRSE